MNASLLEAQVRNILNSRIVEHEEGEESSSVECPFAIGDVLIVRNSFVEMRSYKNEHQSVFDAGLRLAVVDVDSTGNARVNTVDNRWKQDKWITSRNFFNLQKKNSQIQKTRPLSVRSDYRPAARHGRSHTLDTSHSMYEATHGLAQAIPSTAKHARRKSVDPNFGSSKPSREEIEARLQSSKEELRNRIRKAMIRRQSQEMDSHFLDELSTTAVNSPRSDSDDDFSEPAPKLAGDTSVKSDDDKVSNYNPKVPIRQIHTSSNPDLDRVRQREVARTPPVVGRDFVSNQAESVGTPMNARAESDGVPQTFAHARHVSRSSSFTSILSKQPPPRSSSYTEVRKPKKALPQSASFSESRQQYPSFSSELRRTPEKSNSRPDGSRRRKSSVVFCDCDGVLNTAYTPIEDDGLPLDSILIDRVVKLCKSTNSNIVLTSTWREDQVAYEKLFRTFQQRGITVLGRTPSMNSRSMEVLAWLRHNQRHVRNWVILDDRMELFSEQYELVSSHLVLVDEDEGVTDSDVAYAISILNPEPISSAVRRKLRGTIDSAAEQSAI